MRHSEYASQACRISYTPYCASFASTVSSQPKCISSILFCQSLPRSTCGAASLSDQTHIPGDSHRQSAASCQICTMQQQWSRGRYTGPPRLDTCNVCSSLGKHLMLCMLRVAIDVKLICLSSTLNLLPNSFTPSLWLRFILGGMHPRWHASCTFWWCPFAVYLLNLPLWCPLCLWRV